MRRNGFIIVIALAALLAVTACGSSEQRKEIERRREALKHKQDSTLLASQHELAVVDSMLEAVKAEYERMKTEVEQHKAELRATEEELTALTLLRMRRDSLKVQWEVLGSKIRYIRSKQAESQTGEKDEK